MNADTPLHRQVHPAWLQEGRVTSQVFRPTPKDENHLSVYDGDQIDAEPAFRHYTEELQHASIGVLSVLVSECTALELDVRPDPEPFPEHAVIDFSTLTGKGRKRAAKSLRSTAETRGWQFRVNDDA